VTGVTREPVTRSTVPTTPRMEDTHDFVIRCPTPVGPGGIGEVNQVAEKKITPVAAPSTKTSSKETAARVEKKSMRKHKKKHR